MTFRLLFVLLIFAKPLTSHEVDLPTWVRPGHACTLDLNLGPNGLVGHVDLEAPDVPGLSEEQLLKAFRLNGQSPKSIRAEAPKRGSKRWALQWDLSEPKTLDLECNLFREDAQGGWCRVFIFFGGEDPERAYFFRTRQSFHWPQVAGPSPGEQEMLRWSSLIGQGYRHILPLGTDHILFVLGLCLGATSLLSLLGLITAFTLAHSISLGLATAGLVQLSPRLVEPLIALSIAVVALENAIWKRPPTWRWPLVFAFGLLHGLGFAGALRSLGLPQGSWARVLFGFNAGVELGQLSVIGGFLLMFWWARRRPWYRSRVQVPLSALMALTGLVWCLQRVLT